MATRLNGDVQYVLGGLSVAGDIGWVDTFVHRPLPYRLFMSILNVGAGLLGLHTTDYVAYESVVRAGGIALALVSGALLWRALVPRLGRAAAAVIGGATSLALILAPAHDVLQAEWAATSLAVMSARSSERPSTRKCHPWSRLMVASAVPLITAARSRIQRNASCVRIARNRPEGRKR